MFSILIFIFGLAVGSFLNVVIYRLETEESILISRSHCPKCGAILSSFDLIPIFSFIWQKAKCRYCRQKISWQYPTVEIATGLLFLIIFSLQSSVFSLFYYFLIISFLIIIFVYDLKHYLIPDKIVYPAILASGIWYLVSGFFIPNTKYQIPNTIMAVLAGAGFFLILVLISKGKWLGLGDVKLGILMGLVLGWPNILSALFLAIFGGAVVGLGLIAAKKKTMKSQIPFGPFLAGATVLTMLFNDYLTQALNWFMLG